MRIFKELPSQKYLQSIMYYKDGFLYKKSDNKLFSNKATGFGYRATFLNGNKYSYHRIVWTLINGEFPRHFHIDHTNGIRSDNRIENLRLCNGEQENNQNKSIYKNNKSGFPGVTWHKRYEK